MSTKIADELIQEATKLLEDWAQKKNLVEKGKRLKVVMTIEDIESVSVEIEDKTKQANLDKVLALPVNTLEMSVRSKSCLENACIEIIGDLVRKTEKDLLKIRNFGKKSLVEIRLKLKKLGLTIGMDIDVGPLEHKVLLQGSFHRYVHVAAIQPFESEGIISVNDLVSRNENEVVSILSRCNPREIGEHPRNAYQSIRASLTRRGVRL